jgi:hypothetical protein
MGPEGRPEPRTIDYDDFAAFRYSDYDTPFWARANTAPGRWHDPAHDPTQYLSLHPDGAWAELARSENLQSDAELALVRMPIWVARISEHGIVDYGDFERAEDAGFPPDALIDDNYTRCQAEGRRLRELGYRGVVAPSAALPGCLNLTLFGPRIVSGWSRERKLASSVPATVVAVGAPAAGLATKVRFVGRPHKGYEEFRKARERSRREPH